MARLRASTALGNERLLHGSGAGGLSEDEEGNGSDIVEQAQLRGSFDLEYAEETHAEEELQPRVNENLFERVYKMIGLWFVKRLADDWVFLLLLGLISAIIGFFMDYIIFKLYFLDKTLYGLTDVWIVQLFFWVTFCVGLVVASAALTNFVAPQAVGSGIPEVKTIMRGFELKGYMTISNLIAKVFGLVLAVGAGLPIGKEGPFVVISALIASVLSKYRVFANIRNSPSRMIDMLGAAAAVGVACNFGAPIGGVMFSIEVTSTYFAVRNYWRGFFGAVVAAFLYQTLSAYDSSKRKITALFTTDFDKFPFDFEELFVFALVGAFLGLCGPLFVYSHRKFVEFNASYIQPTAICQKFYLSFPALASLAIAIITFPRLIGPYMGLSQQEAVNHLFSDKNLNEIDHWNYPNIFFSLTVFIVLKFAMTIVAISLAIPSGVFVPVFALGAAFGRLVGEGMAAAYPNGISGGEEGSIVAGGYAVVGAAALAGSVTHTISTSVIVFELTGQIQHILPVLIAVLIANAIAQSFSTSIYDSMIIMKKFPYLPDLRRGHLYKLSAGTIMTMDVCYVSLASTIEDILHLLEQTTLKSYPLVDSASNMILLGSVKRSLLEGIVDKELEAAAFRIGHEADEEEGDFVGRGADVERAPLAKTSSNASSTTSDRASFAHPTERRLTRFRGRSLSELKQKIVSKVSDDYLAGVQSSSSKFDGTRRLSESNHATSQGEFTIEWREVSRILQKNADLAAMKIDPAPFQLVQETPIAKVHSLFTLLGLTHSFVTATGRLIGVVRLKDLQRAIEKSHRSTLVTHARSGAGRKGSYRKLKRGSDEDDMYESQSFLPPVGEEEVMEDELGDVELSEVRLTQ
eukprot:Nk52_evm138s226 gene=Nk52_evmTU138s226